MRKLMITDELGKNYVIRISTPKKYTSVEFEFKICNFDQVSAKAITEWSSMYRNLNP